MSLGADLASPTGTHPGELGRGEGAPFDMVLGVQASDPSDGPIGDTTGSRPRLIRLILPTPTTFGQLRPALEAALALAPDPARRWYAERDLLPDSQPVGYPPLIDGVILSTQPQPPPPGGPVRLSVTSGPDAGRCFDLGYGRHEVGRSRSCSVRIADPHLSRRHAVLRLDPDGAHWQDVGSTNGTQPAGLDGQPAGLDGQPAGLADARPSALDGVGHAAALGPVPDWRTDSHGFGQTESAARSTQPQPIRLAATTTVRLGVASTATPRLHATGAATLAITPRRQPRTPTTEPLITLPRRADSRPAPTLSALAVGLPVVVSGVIAVALRMWMILAFGAMSTVLTLAHHLGERRRHRRDQRAETERFEQELAACREQIAEALNRERRQLERELPDLASVMATAGGPTSQLWSRPLPGLIVRLGLGDRPAALRIQHHPDRPIDLADPTREPARDGVSARDQGHRTRGQRTRGRRARSQRGPIGQPRPARNSGPGQVSHPQLSDVPIGLDLTEGTVGLLGPPTGLAEGLARSMIAQVLVGWSPGQVAVWLVVDGLDRLATWQWLLWAPQLRPTTSTGRWRVAVAGDAGWLPELDLTPLLDELARRRQAPRSTHARAKTRTTDGRAIGPGDGTVSASSARPQILVVLDRAAVLATHPGMSELLQADPSLGVHLLCLGDPDHPIPTHCVSSVILQGGRAELHSHGRRQSIRPDALATDTAEGMARRLAPMRDGLVAEGATRLPGVVGGQVVSPGPLGSSGLANELARRWREQARPMMRVPIGVDQTGSFELDLSRDGPHALIAGTTGSGKSELLRTLIAALALANHPDQVRFVLIDYKGGSAFDDCARLPHTAGLVTDLDDRLADRALRALAAELRRREELLRQAGVSCIEDLLSFSSGDGNPSGQPPPHPAVGLFRLVLVIDEYRALAEHLPGFIDGLVRIAAQGRSLGVHLVLATQRPAGIVTADIRANVNLRIALRVRDEADSHDILGCADAAFVPRDTPGRALLRCGSDQVREVQTAWVGGSSTRPVDPTPQVTSVDVATGRGLAASAAPTGPASPSPDLSDLRLIVTAAREAARALNFTPPPPPWPPPLPEAIPAQELNPAPPPTNRSASGCQNRPAPTFTGTPTHPFDLATTAPPSESQLCLAIGLLDQPDRQRHAPLHWRPWQDGALGIAGTAGTGRTSALRTVAGLTALGTCPTQVSLCILDGGGGLAPLRALPHTSCYADPTDPAFLRRVITALAGRVCTGRAAGAASGTGRQPDTPPRVMVLIDGWEQLQAAIDRPQPGASWDDLLAVIRLGGSAGVGVMVTGDRALLLPPLAPLLGERIALRLADPNDHLLAGIPGLPRASASAGFQTPGRGTGGPGRGRHLGHAAELQLATFGRHAAEQDAELARIADEARQRHAHCPGPHWRMQPLPVLCRLAELPPVAPDAGVRTVAFGVAADDRRAAKLELGAPGALILGPPGSGRSNALAVIGQLVTAHGRPVSLIARSAPLGGSNRRIDPTHPRAAQDIADLPADALILLDDVDSLLGTGIEDALLARVAQPGRRGSSVLAAGTGRGVSGRYHGLIGALRRSGYALALNPGRAEEEALGVRLPTDEPLMPGRGILVEPNGVTVVQVALAGPAPGWASE